MRMNNEPTEAYVFQPHPPRTDGKHFGVGGLMAFSLSYEEASFNGLDKETAQEIVRTVNKNPEIAAILVRTLKAELGL